MKNVLFCSLASPGFLFPLIGIAQEVQRSGLEVDFATGIDFTDVLVQNGLRRIPRGMSDGPSFTVQGWGFPLQVALQIKHLEYAVAFAKPDVIVTSHLAFGPLLLGERLNVPVVVLGTAAYLYPTKNDDGNKISAERKNFNLKENVRLLSGARDACGFGPLREQTVLPLLGDCYLLQSVPEVYDGRNLPEVVSCIGSATWEPAQDPEGPMPRAEGPSYYVQPGRTFSDADPWPSVRSALSAEPITVYSSTGRRDRADEVPAANYIERPHAPQNTVLPEVSGVISSGHSTSVLGAIEFGKPMMLLPNGSGTYEISELAESLGFAMVLDQDAVAADPAVFADAFHHFKANDEMRTSAERTMQLYAPHDGTRNAAALIRSLA